MKVVLRKDVKNIGRLGEIVEVSDGYARNFLIPKKMADFATPEAVRTLQIKEKNRAEKAKSEQDSALELVQRLNELVIEFNLPADDKGHLYAGLKEFEILDRIRTKEARLSRNARLGDYKPLRMIGPHKVLLNIGLNQLAEINIVIKSQNEAR